MAQSAPQLTPRLTMEISDKIAIVTAGLAFGWWVLDGIFARTVLITPVGRFVGWTACVSGVIVGAWIGRTVAQRQLRKPVMNKGKRHRTSVLLVFCSIGVVFGAMIATQAMWRIASVALFWHSSAEIVATAFPIRSVSWPKGGPIASIGSWGEDRPLSISKQDFDLIGGVRPMRPPWEFCLDLRRQEEGQAVRVWRPSRPRLSQKGLTIIRCPASVRWIK